jgi:nitrous oxide reductase accessory protein NosL
MKKTIFLAFIMAAVLVSCNQKNNENTTNTIEKLENDSMAMEMEMDSMKMSHDTKMFACSMHPEVQGKLNDTCSKCGMKLTEPIEK